MAEALSHITECAVCFLKFVDPRILPCFHSLCAQCVGQIQRGATIKCPMCNTTHDVTKVQNDFRLAQIIEALEGNAPEAPHDAAGANKCVLCREEPVAFLCVECDEWMCEACKIAHLRIRVTKSHHVISLANKCKEVKDNVARQSSSIKLKIDAQSQSIACFDAVIKQLEVTQTNALQESDELKQKSITDVKKYFDSLDARIIDFIQTQISRLEEKKRKLTEQVQEIHSKRDTLERLVRESAAELAVNGASILDDVKQLSESIIDDELHIDDVEIRVVQDSAWNAATAASLQLNGSALVSRATRPSSCAPVRDTDVDRDSRQGGLILNRRASAVRLFMIPEKEYNKEKQCKLSNVPQAFRLINQQLWSCQRKGRIEIYNLDLQLERTLCNTYWGNVNDVTEKSNGQILIACSKGLFHITRSGETICKINNSRHTSAVWRDNKMYACASSIHAPTLHIYRCTNNTWNRLNTLTIRAFSHFAWVTLCVTNSAIYACSAHDNKIIKMSQTGVQLQTTDSEGSRAGQFDRPYLCQADDEDSLLVADRLNNRLQVRDSRGAWRVVRLEPRVDDGRGAVFINNKLYVLDKEHLKLYT